MSVESPTKKALGEKDGRQWSKLSFVAMENIYTFLSRSDQFNMSLVCKSWLNVYSEPSLWKTFVFDFKESDSSEDSWSGTRFGWKYSKSFKHVRIDCSMPPKHYSTLRRQLIAFLHHITRNSQLVSVTFESIVSSASLTDAVGRADVKRAIGDFLASQHRLEKLEFDYSFLKFGDLVELLKQLNEKSKDTLLHLGLKGLEICDSLEAYHDLDAEQDLLSFAGLEGLTAFEIDYSLIFEKALNFFDIKSPQHSPRLALSAISFYYNNTDMNMEYFKELKSIDWQFLSELYPHLQVKSIIVTDSPSKLEVETLIAPEIPITHLDYTYVVEGSFDRASPMDIDELFKHLLVSKKNENLVSLSLAWIKTVSKLDTALIPILQACKKLKTLELVIVSPENVGFLLEFFLKKRLQSLKEVSIYIAGMNEKDYRILLTDSIENVSILQKIGLNVKIYGGWVLTKSCADFN